MAPNSYLHRVTRTDGLFNHPCYVNMNLTSSITPDAHFNIVLQVSMEHLEGHFSRQCLATALWHLAFQCMPPQQQAPWQRTHLQAEVVTQDCGAPRQPKARKEAPVNGEPPEITKTGRGAQVEVTVIPRTELDLHQSQEKGYGLQTSGRGTPVWTPP